MSIYIITYIGKDKNKKNSIFLYYVLYHIYHTCSPRILQFSGPRESGRESG